MRCLVCNEVIQRELGTDIHSSCIVIARAEKEILGSRPGKVWNLDNTGGKKPFVKKEIVP
jgi:hypothetical protein